jgi:hypothetical protein
MCTHSTLSLFVKGDGSPQHRSLTLTWPSQTHALLTATLPYASQSIHNVSEADTCSKTQNVMFAYYSAADIFKYNEQSVGTNIQLTLKDKKA